MRQKKVFYFLLLIVIAIGGIFAAKSVFVKKPICRDCNVIIVGYDTVSAGHVSALGYSRQTTPMLDSLARQGYLFTSNIVPAPWTVPSFMSLFTGLYPSEHKVINKYTVFTKDKQEISNLSKLSPNVETLAQVMKQNGYVTGGFTGDAGVSGQFGYKNGFDVYTDEAKFGSIENSAVHALDWLKKNKEKKFFMFLHGYDAHGQGQIPTKEDQTAFIPKDYKGKYTGSPKEEAVLREQQLVEPINLTPEDVRFWNGVYDSKIRAVDDKFAQFWQELTKMGFDKNTIVIILSDHGEEYYEHKGIDHGHSLYDELVHVPLVFNVPNMPGGVKITQQVTSLDVVPTLFDILGIKPSAQYASQIRGKSLFSAMNGGNITPQDVFLETDYRDFTHKRGIRTHDGWKYIISMESGKQELYNLNTDSSEQNNLIDKNPDMVATLEKRVKQHMLDMGQNPSQNWTIGCLPVYPGECE